jgi:hypothetical protein
MGWRDWFRPGRDAAAAVPSVIVDDVGVRRRLRGGKEESVIWDRLVEVRVVTTRSGPMSEDMYYVLCGEGDAGCVVPSEMAGPDLLPRLQRLPGFRHELMLQAATCIEDAQFVCWQREPVSAGPA